MELLDYIFSYDGPFQEGLGDKFVELYERSRALDWRSVYGDPEEPEKELLGVRHGAYQI